MGNSIEEGLSPGPLSPTEQLTNPIRVKYPDFEDLNQLKPDLPTIRELKDSRFIPDTFPFWWSTDYAPDPRKYMGFDDLISRCVQVGVREKTRATSSMYPWEKVATQEPLLLYPYPEVPMSVLKLKVDKKMLPFFVTARPFHKKERYSLPSSLLLFEHSMEELHGILASGKQRDLYAHFMPHIRGLFAGRRGNHLFWYPLKAEGNWEGCGLPLDNALRQANLFFIDVYEPTAYGEINSYSGVWDELGSKGTWVDQRKQMFPNFPSTYVSAEEFIEDWEGTENELSLHYPLRHPEMRYTMPLFISTKTNKESVTRKPVILGVWADNGQMGFCRRAGICRIKDRSLAEYASESISDDFGIPVDCILFTPRPGRPQYERISVT